MTQTPHIKKLLENQKRNKKIKQLHAKKMSMTAIGVLYGISRQRVKQILEGR